MNVVDKILVLTELINLWEGKKRIILDFVVREDFSEEVTFE